VVVVVVVVVVMAAELVGLERNVGGGHLGQMIIMR
jgi:hypothetical protein